MTSALAPQLNFFAAASDTAVVTESDGAHSLLRSQSFRPAYFAQGAAILVYALALAGLCYLAKPKPVPQDQPIELTMVPDDAPAPTPTSAALAEQTPDAPPLTDPTPPEQTALATPDVPSDQDLTPPVDQQDSVAPVPPPPPPAAVRHHARPKAVAARATSSRHFAAAPATASGGSSAAPSYYANEVHARIASVASDTVPDDFHGSARVFYHIVISPSGELISKSVTPSGNSLFDRAAAEALARAAPFPATGMPRAVSLHGAIAFSQ